ncbi:Hypothetical predicted protein [Podarcis lilfordi]|uniref:Uncharacterized protein n=1 Tax=Podarcis lilfordi TaxID=74358 RepID=A0AA35PRV6_9SAUR|nr:Hypothetical predicted protein [Podarcis lilfordi]
MKGAKGTQASEARPPTLHAALLLHLLPRRTERERGRPRPEAEAELPRATSGAAASSSSFCASSLSLALSLSHAHLRPGVTDVAPPTDPSDACAHLPLSTGTAEL